MLTARVTYLDLKRKKENKRPYLRERVFLKSTLSSVAKTAHSTVKKNECVQNIQIELSFGQKL